MKAKAWRLYGAKDMRLEDIELEAAGEDGIVVELVTNTICLSDYKGVTLGTGHKRVPRDIATRPTMFGHEISGIVRELGRICAANKGLWCKEAEDYLLAHAPKVEIGEPKETVHERRIVLG